MVPTVWLIPVARFVLAQLDTYVDGLTPAQIDSFIDFVNRLIGGNKKFEAASIQVVINAVKTMLDNFKL
jgi:hypothetical protein